MRRIVGAFLVLHVVQTTSIQAQAEPQIHPGDRVRVTAPRCFLLGERGQLQVLHGDSLSLMTEGNLVTCPTSAVTRLEVLRGKRSWWKPALIGAGIVGLGGAFLANELSVCTEKFDEKQNFCPVIGAGIGVPAGFLLGGSLVFILGRELWEEVPLPEIRAFATPMVATRIRLHFSLPLGK